MKERRRHERFSINLPTRVELVTSAGKQIRDLQTNNVCAGGAFFTTDQMIAIGTHALVKMEIRSERLRDLAGVETLVQLTGVVIRSEPTGVAIRFSGDYKILKLQNSSSISTTLNR